MRRISIIVFICFMYFALACSVDANSSKCEINVKQGSATIQNKTGYFNFGNIPLNFNQSIVFTIENIGVERLELNGTNKVEIAGQNTDDFILSVNQTKSHVDPENETTFKITFFPKSIGKKTASVSIENNDSDENPYTFLIVGTCTQPAPEMHVKFNNQDVVCTTGSIDLGSAVLNSTTQYFDVMIFNNGNENLTLNGSNRLINISGTDASVFTIDETNTYTTITSGNSTSFKIAFHPTTLGVKTATISILNNDSDENPYTFHVTGTCIAAPEINIKQGIKNIPCTSGSYIFPDVLANESTPEIPFTIENLGSTTLQLNGNPDTIEIGGTNASSFSVDTTGIKLSFGPGDSTIFKMTFSPTVVGYHQATVSIPNIDSDEDPYVFKISGTCVSPEITVKRNGFVVPHSTGLVDFCYIVTGKTSPKLEFTIENSNIGDLKLTGTPKVDVTGTDHLMFDVDDSMTTTPVSNGKFTTFTVAFKPTTKGLKQATISIANNDYDENPYTFTVKGTGIDYVPGLAIGWIGGGTDGWHQTNGTNTNNDYRSFNSLNSVFVDSDENIYVADTQNHRICKWDFTGSAIGWIGSGSNGWKTSNTCYSSNNYKSFNSPRGVFVDSTGYIYVADTKNHRISKWDKNGNAIGWIGGTYKTWQTGNGAPSTNHYENFNHPSDVCVDSAGYIYVADTANHRISKWTPQGSAVGYIGNGCDGWQATFGAYSGSDYRSFSNPFSLDLDSAGNIYVCDTDNNRISKWNAQGVAQGWIGGGYSGWQKSSGANFGSQLSYFYCVCGVTVTSNGTIYVSDSTNNRISKWDSAGNAIGWIGNGSDGWKTTAPSQYGSSDYRGFDHQRDIYVSSSGGIYVADHTNSRICKWLD